jgi:uncharacterized LabA/DUF88 family protein
METVAIFVDVQNIYYTCRDTYQRQFNYRAFWQQATHGRKVIAANAYAIDRGDSKQLGFQKALRSIGFNICLKPFIQRSDGSAKGDWDVGITIDVMEQAADADVIILLSGDGDFDLLMKKVGEKYHCRTEVYGVPNLTAASLVNASDFFCKIEPSLLL